MKHLRCPLKMHELKKMRKHFGVENIGIKKSVWSKKSGIEPISQELTDFEKSENSNRISS